MSAANLSPLVTINIGSEETVKGVAISPDGKKILALNKETAQIWDVESQKKVYEAENPAGPNVLPAAISPDGKIAAYLRQERYLSDEDGPVILVDIASAKELGRLSDKNKKFRSAFERLAFSPKENLLVTISDKSEICGWDTKSGDQLFVWPTNGEAITAVSELFDDGQKIVTGDKGGVLKIWDLKTGKTLKTLPDGPDKEQILKIAVTPDGKTLVSAALVGKIKIWDLATGMVRKEIDNDLALQAALILLPDQRTLLHHDRAKNILLIDLETGARRKFPTGHDASDSLLPLALAVSGDGKTLVSGGQKGIIKVWQLSK